MNSQKHSIKAKFLLISVYLFFTTSNLFADTKLVELVKKVKPATGLIITYDENDNVLKQGSGFFIDSNGCFATNYHVIKNAYSAIIKTPNKQIYAVDGILASNIDADIVKLKVDTNSETLIFLTPLNYIPDPGEDVVVVGTPKGLEATVSKGIISAVRDIPGTGKIIQISAEISPGSSGSPVMDMNGNVIGVATFQITDGQALNFAISSEILLDLQEDNVVTTLSEFASFSGERDSNKANILFDQAIKRYWAGNTQKALKLLEKVIKEDPSHAMAHFDLGVLYSEFGNYAKAIECFKKSIELDSSFYGAYYNLSTILISSSRYSEAREVLESSLGLAADHGDTYFALGATYNYLGMDQESLNAFKLATEYDPTNISAWYFLGTKYLATQQHEEALSTFLYVITTDDTYALAHQSLGKTYYYLKRYGDAIVSLKDSIKHAPESSESYFLLGMCYTDLGEYETSFYFFKEAVKRDPSHIHAHFMIGLEYVRRGDTQAALQEYLILKSLDKETANTFFEILY